MPDLLSMDVFLHMVLEAIGGAVLYYAMRSCKHWRHRVLRWVIFAYIFSVLTVWLVG